MEINFATGNARKLQEAVAACEPLGISVVQAKVDSHEIQHHDPLVIAKHKAEQAFKQIGKPTVINDTSWNIPSLNGFPGGYMKDVAEWFKPEDFINLVKDKEDKRICCIETVVYMDKNETRVFNKDYWGTISLEAKGSGNSLERVAVFNNKTLGEFRAENKLAFDPKDYIWHEFAKWFKSLR